MILNSLYSFAATFGFCIIFNIKGRNLFFTSLGGALSWFVYLLLKDFNFSNTSALFLSSLALGLYSEVMARVLKSPVTTFVICALIPLVPGSGMYYTMLESIQGNISKSLELAVETLSSAGALAVGIVFISSIAKLLNHEKIKRLKL
jgi:uncharacterized membrane protein YjjB (DUF3815 family)